MSNPKRTVGFPQPSRREFFGGLTVITILACVGVTRQGTPDPSFAVVPINDPLAQKTSVAAARGDAIQDQPQADLVDSPLLLMQATTVENAQVSTP